MTNDTFPRRLGKFILLEEIARGGMGIVYKAEQGDPRRIVALKVLRSDDAVQRERFLKEVATAARLVHPGILPVFEVGVADDQHFFTMEYIEGKPLDRWLLEDAPDVSRKVEIVRDIARAMHYAHEQNILHRDLKPANILLDKVGHAWITDFGIAREMGLPSTLTGTGMVVGTPSYMSPEQALGQIEKFGPRIDIYGLGAVLYESLTGRPPFLGKNDVETLEALLHEELVPPGKLVAGLSPDLERVVLKSLEKDLDQRYATAEDFAEDLQRTLRGEPVHADPGGPLYRKWRRRKKNKALTTALVVFAVLFIVGEVIFLTQYDRLQTDQAALALREAQRAEAKNAFERGQLARGKAAVEAFSRAIAADPTFAEAYFERGKARIHTGEFAPAVEDLTKAIQQRPGMTYAYYWRGVVCQDYLGRPEDARKDFDKVAQLDPESDIGYLGQGALLEAEGKPKEAESFYTRAIDRVPTSALGYQRRAQVRIALGRLDESIADARKALVIDPESAPVLHNLAVALTQRGELDEAIETLAKALQFNPRNALHYHSRAVALALKKQYKEAIEDYSRAIALDGRLAMTFLGRARALYETGELSDAMRDCSMAIGLAPDFADPFAARGLILYQKELYPDAIRDWEQFLKVASADHPARASIQQQMENARKRSSPLTDRRVLVEDWIQQAEDAFIARRIDRAEDCYRKALELDPSLGMAHYGLACVFAQRYAPYREFRSLDMWDKERKRRFLNTGLDHLAHARKAGFGQIDELAQDPDLASLRDDPRFMKILRGSAFEPD